MNELLKKMSSYNIFNYLFSGVIFIVFSETFLDINMPIKINEKWLYILNYLLLAYFIGLTISRIGSLLIEPLIKCFLETKNYAEFIRAEKKDSKVSVLSEQNNVYRTLIALFVVLLLMYILKHKSNIKLTIELSSLTFLSIVYLLSYIKQTLYITKRIEVILDEKE